MKWHLDDRCCEGKLRTQRIANLELGLAEGRRDPILETTSDRAQAHQLASLPYPVGASKAEAQAGRVRERPPRSIDHPDQHRPRAIGACLQRTEPLLRNLPH